MVSNFALALSFEGIALLRRIGSTWARIEEVPIDNPDLDVAVIAMRDRAEKLDPKGAEVAIVIPTEQIRFLDIPDFGGDTAARDAAIRAALDGATPYPLSALAYDHALVGGRLQIAAVARETLDEAETFAKEHGFTPVCHLAQAPEGAFDGAVYFGKARTWKRAADRPSRAIEIVAANEAALTPVASAAPTSRRAEPVAAPEPFGTAELPDHAAAELPEARNMAPAPTNLPDDGPVLPLRDDAPVYRAPANFAPTAEDEAQAGRTAPSSDAGTDDTAAEAASAGAEAARLGFGEKTIPAFATLPEPDTDTLPAMPALPEMDAPERPEPVTARTSDGAPDRLDDAATDTDQTETAPVAFSTSRALRADGRVPPAPRPNLVPSTEVPPRRARFTPLATPDMRTRDSQVTSDHIEGLADLKPAAMPLGRTSEAPPIQPASPATPPAPGTPLTARADETTLPAGNTPLPKAPAPGTTPAASAPGTQQAPLPPAPRPVGPAADRPSAAPSRALGAPSRPDASTAAPTLGAAGRPEADGPARPLGVPSHPEAGTSAPTVGAANPQTGETPKFGSPLPRQTGMPESEPRPKKSGLRLGRKGKGKRAATATDNPAPAAAAPRANPAESAPKKRKPGLRLTRRDKTPAPAPVDTPPPAVAMAASGGNPLARLAALRAPDAVPPAAARVAKLAKLNATPDRIPPAPTGAPLSPLKIQPDPEPVDDLPLPVAKPVARTAPDIAPVTPGKPALERDRRSQMSPREERDRMTVFGAREQQAVGGKPRFLGLILTAGLLLFLVGVAAWASVFLEDGLARFFRGQDEPTAVAALPDPAVTGTPAETSTPAATPEATGSDQTAPDAQADSVDVAALNTEPVDTTDAPAPRNLPEAPRALTPEEADATYAATGIWQRSPASPLTPPDDGVDNVYVASIDPSVRMFDAVALPEAPDLLSQPFPVDPGLPPPAGMTFDIDERGVVRATPEGALTPDGLRIYTGPPPVVPPLRNPPVELAALPAPDTPATSDAPDAPAVTDPLAGIRPEARPDDVVEQQERATLGGISLQELEQFRPLARPRTAQEEAADEEPSSPATDLAVRNSLEPVGRPRNMAAIVERAERERPTEPVQTAAVAPRVVAPSVPSSASVASSATVRNAINLSRINLIGVYGTPANRRALVRLASGKYLKVKVGDKLDGGRVAAIGDSELRYTKGGRNVTLQMPRG
ncbi:hypothetical protein [Sagittula stellata]|uniref:Uncharacterized protein n=1 Tax=Sagittula stellata (strain ATCC 700073 / DSM 11524 / E-37) TaxID=388399 RepID=A3JZM8_SAGS3|nr:hypothetical protein [Sagittula stellata]EBA09931.1 hypothetical protein SSE37_08983 [Sagittula stellata E-37]